MFNFLTLNVIIDQNHPLDSFHDKTFWHIYIFINHLSFLDSYLVKILN